MSRQRGFEVVRESARTAFEILTDEKRNKHQFPKTITLPTRADTGSAGWDFYIPKDVDILPSHKAVIFTDVKAFMQPDEVLEIYIRSSVAIKQDLVLTNSVGIIDSSYYGNSDNDGNIGIAVKNTSGKVIHLKEGERIAQGIFKKFLTIDDETPTVKERKSGLGSSGK